MQKRLYIFGFVLMMFSIPSHALAQVSVSAQVNRTTVAPGVPLQMQVKVSGSGGEIDLSPIMDFEVRARGTSSNVQFINGQMSKEVIYDYQLMPRGRGKLTIPPLEVTVDGQRYRTNPITVTVTDQPQTAQGNPSAGKEVWITADISENAPFSGQQITYTFRFYRSVSIDDAKFQPPAFKGFSSREVKDRHAYRKVINGREHVVTEVYFILTPLEEGELTIEPAVVHVGVLRKSRNRPRSPFEDFFNRSIVEPRVLKTQPLKIAVRSLPPSQKQDFSGLVGQFEMAAEMESSHLYVGDSATLTITLQGKGNIADAQHPPLALPPEFKSYQDNPEQEIQVNREGVSGKKVFRTALVPVAPGKFALAPIQFTYFDVENQAFLTLKAQLPMLTVSPAAGGQSAPLTVTPGNLPLLKKKVAFTGRDILPPKDSLAAIESHRPLAWPLFLLILVAPASLYGIVLLTQHIRRPDTSAAAIMKTRARRALKRAQTDGGEDFMTSLYQAITAAIFSASNRSGEALTWREAEALLLENHFCAKDAAAAANLLADIESLKFGGMDLDERRHRTLLEETQAMVRRLTA